MKTYELGTVHGYASDVFMLHQHSRSIVKIGSLVVDDAGLALILEAIGRERVIEHFGAALLAGGAK